MHAHGFVDSAKVHPDRGLAEPQFAGNFLRALLANNPLDDLLLAAGQPSVARFFTFRVSHEKTPKCFLTSPRAQAVIVFLPGGPGKGRTAPQTAMPEAFMSDWRIMPRMDRNWVGCLRPGRYRQLPDLRRRCRSGVQAPQRYPLRDAWSKHCAAGPAAAIQCAGIGNVRSNSRRDRRPPARICARMTRRTRSQPWPFA
jgi:hypothetical protein